MTDKEIIKNAHCKYFEGQTGQCQAKEFIRCNPINCKLYTIDELSTILDLQKQLRHKEQECEELKEQVKLTKKHLADSINEYNRAESYKQALEKIQEYCIPYLKHNPKSPAIDLNDIVKILNEVNS